MTKICFKVLLYLTLVARWGLHFGRGAEANEVTESLQGGGEVGEGNGGKIGEG